MNNPWRENTIAALTSETLDLLVIGGGIVGAGVAREAAMRAIKIGLVDQFDFAEGTSSRSSRLLHGGLRYLAQGHLGLVRESSVEKRILHKIAPHLALPLPFVLPTYKDRPAWKRWKLGIGVKIYDALCGWKNFGPSSKLSPAEVEKIAPGVRAEKMTGGVRYFDGFTNDSRLVIDTLRSAARNGARVCNRLRLADARREGDTWLCLVIDTENNQPHEIRSRAVVSACGPWAQRAPNTQILLRLTKGVHVVVDRAKLPLDEALVMTEGKRILFGIPWGERTIIGTTDTDYQGPPENAACDAKDVEYLLGIVNEYFPDRKISAGDIRATWAGVRPLVADGSKRTFETSRSHVIRRTARDWIEVAGGKLTTYRKMAAQTLQQLKLKNSAGSAPTDTQPLLDPGEAEGISGVIPPAVTERAVRHYCENEWAIHLADVMLRRGGWHYYVEDPLATAQQVAAWMAQSLGWDAQRIAEEFAAYQRAKAFIPSDKAI
jgi:glycerol-3-phosphate dehydrogenase